MGRYEHFPSRRCASLPVHHGEIPVRTGGETEIVDLTGQVQSIVEHSGIRSGIVSVFNSGSTGSVTTLEFEPGVVEDMRRTLEHLAPKGLPYQHNIRNGDDNGHSHVRHAFLGPGVSLPLRDGRVVLGRWQQVVFIELDTRPRERRILVDIVGE